MMLTDYPLLAVTIACLAPGLGGVGALALSNFRETNPKNAFGAFSGCGCIGLALFLGLAEYAGADMALAVGLIGGPFSFPIICYLSGNDQT